MLTVLTDAVCWVRIQFLLAGMKLVMGIFRRSAMVFAIQSFAYGFRVEIVMN